MNKQPRCSICGQLFNDVFEAADHFLEEGEIAFDPKLILPNGCSLMVGSLLRDLYANANSPNKIKATTQYIYALLLAAENGTKELQAVFEEMLIRETMHNFDEDLVQLLEEENPKNDNERGE